jgi:hypothetical protein
MNLRIKPFYDKLRASKPEEPSKDIGRNERKSDEEQQHLEI